MTLSHQLDIRCPNCEHPFSAEVWNSINVTLDPGLKEQFLSHQINCWRCPECASSITILNNLLYHDMAAKYMIWMFPEYPPDFEGFDQTELIPGYQHRIVHSYNHLIEKVIIFDMGLNDLAVEIAKFELITQAAHNGLTIAPEQLFLDNFSQNEQQKDLSFVHIAPDEADNQVFTLPWSQYQSAIVTMKKHNRSGEEPGWNEYTYAVVRDMLLPVNQPSPSWLKPAFRLRSKKR